MAYTTAQHTKLRNAIAAAADRIATGDNSVQYRDLENMLKIDALMSAELGVTALKQISGVSASSIVEFTRE